MATAQEVDSNSVQDLLSLGDDAYTTHMGGGGFVLFSTDEHGTVHSVPMSNAALERFVAHRAVVLSIMKGEDK